MRPTGALLLQQGWRGPTHRRETSTTTLLTYLVPSFLFPEFPPVGSVGLGISSSPEAEGTPGDGNPNPNVNHRKRRIRQQGGRHKVNVTCKLRISYVTLDASPRGPGHALTESHRVTTDRVSGRDSWTVWSCERLADTPHGGRRRARVVTRDLRSNPDRRGVGVYATNGCTAFPVGTGKGLHLAGRQPSLPFQPL
jgi:hypothetical protein